MEKITFNIDTKRGKLTQHGVLFAGGVREVDFGEEVGENVIMFLFHRRENLLFPVALTERGEDGTVRLNMNKVAVREAFSYDQAEFPGAVVVLQAYLADGSRLSEVEDGEKIAIHELDGAIVAHGTVVLTWAPFNFEEDGRMVTMKGKQGEQGIPGKRGTSIVKFEYVSEDERGFLYRVKFDDGKSADIVIPKGDKGDTGNGIKSITKLQDDPEGNHYYRITMTDGSTFDFTSTKGDKGDRGTDVLSVEYVRDLENGDKVYKINLSDRPSHEIVVPKGDKGKEIVDFTFVSEESRFWNYLVNFTDGSNTPIKIPKGEKVELIVEAKLSSGEVATGAEVTIHYGSAEGPIAGMQTIGQYGVMFELTRGQEWTAVVSDKFGYLTPEPIQGRADYSDKIEFDYRTYAEASSFADIKKVVNACEAVEGGIDIAKAALIAKVIDDVWTDLDATGSGSAGTDTEGHPRYLDPMVVTDIKEVEDEENSTHLGAVLTRMYGAKKKLTINTSTGEALDSATELYAEEGVYYHGKQSSDYYYTALNLKVGDPIPYDSWAEIKKSFQNDGRAVTLGDCIYYNESLLHQYLNSNKDSGWFVKYRVGRKGTGNFHGYMKGCSEELLKAVKNVVHYRRVSVNGSLVSIKAYFIIPSKTEVYGATALMEGSRQSEYWKKITGAEISPSDNNAALNNMRKVKGVDGSAFETGLTSSIGSISYPFKITAGGDITPYSPAFSGNRYTPMCVIF